MFKTLRITSFVCIAAAGVGVLFMLVFGLRSNTEIEGLLAKPSIIEQLRKTTQAGAQKDTVSLLVLQAKNFVSRINPPPPPPPPPPPKPRDEKPVQTATDVLQPNRTISGKFDLLATACYPKYPEKSLALLNLVSEGQKWYRQGESVGRFQIQEVKDGSIVLYQSGKFNSELFVPPSDSIQSLLKSDQKNPVAAKGPFSATTTFLQDSTGNAVPVSVNGVQPVLSETSSAGTLPQGNTENAVPVTASGVRPVLPQGTGQARVPPGAVRIGQPEPLPTVESSQPQPPESEPTPAEQKVSVEESIAGIKQIMNESREGMPDAERQEENKAWEDLLKVLEEEKKSLENAEGQARPASDANENTDKR
jgi:hypothetical protein